MPIIINEIKESHTEINIIPMPVVAPIQEEVVYEGVPITEEIESVIQHNEPVIIETIVQ